VKRTIDKLSNAELKKVQTQIDYLLEKVFIRPSSRPWGSSILSYRKIMVDSVYAQTAGPSIMLRFETNTRFLG
jgi:hypothetical protein